jgi:hypothetical protein
MLDTALDGTDGVPAHLGSFLIGLTPGRDQYEGVAPLQMQPGQSEVELSEFSRCHLHGRRRERISVVLARPRDRQRRYSE